MNVFSLKQVISHSKFKGHQSGLGSSRERSCVFFMYGQHQCFPPPILVCDILLQLAELSVTARAWCSMRYVLLRSVAVPSLVGGSGAVCALCTGLVSRFLAIVEVCSPSIGLGLCTDTDDAFPVVRFVWASTIFCEAFIGNPAIYHARTPALTAVFIPSTAARCLLLPLPSVWALP
ncbi:hypothetical protein F2Q70_00045181 [Brassica cretica]|uniref:Uncharacterized protein n=1 Tax=Brassica cretica TaxID=69181 RepID=A0A8S9KID2_BRACR|nr:hypothetical protein F2Q70_00045181 [Brassica cretica]KAF2609386.1 hypothetical protein F2Q68_00046184 [Brassica cretica]